MGYTLLLSPQGTLHKITRRPRIEFAQKVIKAMECEHRMGLMIKYLPLLFASANAGGTWLWG
jgi:hypothetical protein